MQQIQKFIGIDTVFLDHIIVSILTIIAIWIVRRLIVKIIIDKIEDITLRYRWKKYLTYIFVIIGIIIIAPIWLGNFSSVGTFLGLLSAGLAIAFKDPIVNLAGWLFILIRKPFIVGDRIQIGIIKGDVIDLRIFQFTVLEIGNWVNAEQSTGRIIHIPNGKVFIESQANYSTGFDYIWNEMPVLITFESDWKKAKEILGSIVFQKTMHLSPGAEKQIKEAAKKFLIFYNTLTPTVYTSVKDSGVELTMRFLCDPRKRRDLEQTIWEEVLKEFSSSQDIDFAYPTQRFYNNKTEGKQS
jgi:small-conductance mechanosensitive channel